MEDNAYHRVCAFISKMVNIGIVGIFRGLEFYKNAKLDCKVVAICEKNNKLIEKVRVENDIKDVVFYQDYDEFLNHNMDAVVLANYANEHAPFAIKALKKGKHVLSEVLPVQTLKEAVELVETIEETGLIYSYGENYCYFDSTRKIKELYQKGLIGEFEYGEGEYVHNCEPIWPDITYGEENHWRNNMYATFYCTHSIGPLIHITKLRPISVVGFELPYNDRMARMGSKGGTAGIEMITLENGAIIKSLHGNLSKNSIWYSLYGTKGRIESVREDAINDSENIIYSNYDTTEISYDGKVIKEVLIKDTENKIGHGGSDYYALHNFIKKINGEEADTIDIYEALDMFLPGLFAYKSILKGNCLMKIPDFRDKQIRENYRYDTTCSDIKVAKDMYVYPYSKGKIEVPQETYKQIKEQYLKKFSKGGKKDD